MATRTRLTPHRWTPPKDAGLTGAFTPQRPAIPTRLLPVGGIGPEDTALDAQGRLLTGLADGRIVRMTTDGDNVEVLANTGGRPLGIEVEAAGGIIVCDADRGLLRVHPDSGEVEVLVSEVAGVRLRLTNNAALAHNGDIYFSESSQRFSLSEFKGDILEHSATGRLLRRNADGTVEVLLTDLSFANGVALAPDESFLLVAETGAYRVQRLDLAGASAGQSRVVIDNLPGMPDNMSTGSDGLFWIAMPSTRNRLLDTLLPRPGALRSAIWRLPDRLQPEADRITWVCAIDGDGTIKHNLYSAGEPYHYVTGVTECAGELFLGSLVESEIAVLALAD